MKAEFWHNKWEQNQIGFHLSEANPILTKHLPALKLNKGDTLFLPLCGKTKDIAWLLDAGYHVKGAELSPIAIDQLFEELNLTPQININGPLTHYSADRIDIFVGDIFDITKEIIGSVDAVYDRAALVALPLETRQQYSKHLIQMTNEARQLLICFEYDQSIADGPPFSIDQEEVLTHYDSTYQIKNLERLKLPMGLKGSIDAIETAWLIH
ncbi:MAG: thiopurine S-methyltransferase [Reichenbachiella sp.]